MKTMVRILITFIWKNKWKKSKQAHISHTPPLLNNAPHLTSPLAHKARIHYHLWLEPSYSTPAVIFLALWFCTMLFLVGLISFVLLDVMCGGANSVVSGHLTLMIFFRHLLIMLYIINGKVCTEHTKSFNKDHNFKTKIKIISQLPANMYIYTFVFNNKQILFHQH